MKAFLFDHRRLIAWSFVVIVPLLVAIVAAEGDVRRALTVTGAVLCCTIIPLTALGFTGLFAVQTAKVVIEAGQYAAASIRRRKSHSGDNWTNTREPLNLKKPYTIGDDGELIELHDEKPKHANHSGNDTL